MTKNKTKNKIVKYVYSYLNPPKKVLLKYPKMKYYLVYVVFFSVYVLYEFCYTQNRVST